MIMKDKGLLEKQPVGKSKHAFVDAKTAWGPNYHENPGTERPFANTKPRMKTVHSPSFTPATNMTTQDAPKIPKPTISCFRFTFVGFL